MCVRGERREWEGEWVCEGKEDGFAVNHHLYVSSLGCRGVILAKPWNEATKLAKATR